MESTQNNLTKTIEQDIKHCGDLLLLLDQEKALLAQRDFELLDKLIEDKSRILIQLDQNAMTRSRWVASYQAQQQVAPQTAQDAFAKLVHEHGLQENWKKLQQLLQQCQTTNEMNGKMMVRSRATHQRLLNILRGQNNSGALYNGKGGKNNGFSGATIGQA